MSARKKAGITHWLRRFFSPKTKLPPEIVQAKTLLTALDAGGVPLNPLRINAIARNLGLEVSRQAPMEETIQRIRAAVGRTHAGSLHGSKTANQHK